MKKNQGKGTFGLSTLVGWAPLVVSAGVLCQLYANGLLPALENAERLDRERSAIDARCQRLSEEARRLEAEERMLADEIYRERVRRTLHDPRQTTLTLERAHALAAEADARSATADRP